MTTHAVGSKSNFAWVVVFRQGSSKFQVVTEMRMVKICLIPLLLAVGLYNSLYYHTSYD